AIERLTPRWEKWIQPLSGVLRNSRVRLAHSGEGHFEHAQGFKLLGLVQSITVEPIQAVEQFLLHAGVAATRQREKRRDRSICSPFVQRALLPLLDRLALEGDARSVPNRAVVAVELRPGEIDGL